MSQVGIRIYAPEEHRMFYGDKNRMDAYSGELQKIDGDLADAVVMPQFNTAYKNVTFEICVPKTHDKPEELATAFWNIIRLFGIARPEGEKLEVRVTVSAEMENGKKFLHELKSTPKS